MKFIPIEEDLPISFAFENKDVFCNKARSKAWGGDVFFFPPNYTLDQYGCGGYHYLYGHTYNEKLGKKSNCTYTAGAMHLKRSGELLTCVISKAVNIFDKYEGRKHGGKFDNTYIGETIQPGDWLIFADDKNKVGDGHIVTVEKVGDKLLVSEGAYSDKEIYEGKTCIVYQLNKKDMYTGKRIMLRPSIPFYEYLVGVCHTGDCYDKEDDYESLYKVAKEKLDKIEDILKG